MSRYEGDEYGEDLDEYEDEEQEEEGVGEEEYEGEEKEDAPQPTQEELEYLELRKRLKDSIRKQLKKESSSSVGNSLDSKKKLPYDNYGSFFGPSQPVIAQRVIQESRSFLENEHLRVSKSNHNKEKRYASTSIISGSKSNLNENRPRVVNEIKTKVQKLKDRRDYSFLLSDDAELPAPAKDPPPQKVSGSLSDARSAQVPPKNKQSFYSNGKQLPNGSRQVSNGCRQSSNGPEEKKKLSSGTHVHPRAVLHKSNSMSKPISKPVDSTKQLVNSNRSGPGKSAGPKPAPSKVPAAAVQKKVLVAGAKTSVPGVHKPSSTKSPISALSRPSVQKQSSVQKRPLDQKKVHLESAKGKMLSKQHVASKPQTNKPSEKNLSRPTLERDRPKKRPVQQYSDDEEEVPDFRSMIRGMFGYNPKKYADNDDDSDMEANFDDIMREEKRSARIARQEDEEELRKLEEEERRERLRKEAKKRKLSHR